MAKTKAPRKTVERQPIGTRMDTELYREVKYQALDERVSIEALIEKAVREYLEKAKAKDRKRAASEG